MFKGKLLPAMFIAYTLGATHTLAVSAQPWPGSPYQGQGQGFGVPGGPVDTLRDPLIQGAPTSPAFIPPVGSQPPPRGSGSIPLGVTPGMSGPPTLIPSVPAIPANSVDQANSGLALPFTPGMVAPPGVLGPALSGLVPGPESTLGTDPGSLTAPPGYINAANQVNINPDGGIPGTGGYNGTINHVRRGGQETRQYELRGRNAALGGAGGDGSQDNVARLGPWAGYGVVTGVPTGDGMRNSALDLGAGQRIKVAGVKISTGSSIQDFGDSATRNNPIFANRAQRSFNGSQGLHNEPIFSNKSTDFGKRYTQFNQANEPPQKQDQLKLPTAVQTDF